MSDVQLGALLGLGLAVTLGIILERIGWAIQRILKG